jgi:hypothetical protein
MRIEVEDLYIDCDEIIKEANELYSQVIRQDLTDTDKEYIDSMNRYINNHTRYREKIIKNYIDDLRAMI